MTLEEFENKLKLEYRGGFSGDTGASRRYHDSILNIGAEIHTPRNKETREWGEGQRTYYMENDKRCFDSIEELYHAYEKSMSKVTGL